MPAVGQETWIRRFPPARWLAEYRAAWLRSDIVAGVTLAAYAIPVSLAYAGLAGLPPQVGVYGYLLGGLGYALLGSSRQLAIGPTSAISLMIAGTVGAMAEGDAQRYAQIASLAALHRRRALPDRLAAAAERARQADQRQHPGGLQGRRRLDHRDDPAAEPVRRGRRRAQFLRAGRAVGRATRPDATTSCWPSASSRSCCSCSASACCREGRSRSASSRCRSSPRSVLGLPALGVPTTGEIPAGLPTLEGPALRLRDVEGIVPLAAGCLLLAYIEGVSAARTFAAKHGYALDPRQELLGIGAANLATALGHGYPVAGGLSQSAVNDKAGARTPLALVFASITLALCLLFLTGLLENLPKAVLAAVVLTAVSGLFDFPALLRMWRVSRLDFYAAAIALVARAAARHPARHPARRAGLRPAAARRRVASARGVPRPHSRHQQLLRPRPSSRKRSAARRDRLSSRSVADLRQRRRRPGSGLEPPSGSRPHPTSGMVVCDLSASPYLDLAGSRMLHELHGELAARGIALRIVGAHGRVRDLLRADGIGDKVGGLDGVTTR